MNVPLEEATDAARRVECVRLDLEQCQRELGGCRRRMEQMEGLFAHVADSILVAEPDGRIVDVNPAACELLGYSKDELLALYPWDLVTSATREQILDLTRNMQRGLPVTVQHICRSKKGEQKIMDLRLTRCDLVGRDLTIVSCRDVTEQKRLEDRLRQSERNLAEGQRLTRTGSWILDFKTGNTDWSVETCRIFGFPDPPPSPHYGEFRARVRAEDREGVDRGLRESFEAGEPRPLEYWFVLSNGVRKYIETISQPVLNDAGEVVKLMGTVMDVTERKHAETLLAGEKRLLEMIARGDELMPVLDSLCRLGEEICDDILVSILLVSPDGKRLRHGAAPGIPASYTQAIDGGLIGPNSASCGTAAYRGETVIVSDIGRDPLWAGYRELALAHGLRACWSTPIFSSERRVIGTFALYAREPGNPTPEHQFIIEQFAHIASIAIERTQAQETLRRNEAYLAEAQKLSHVGSFSIRVESQELLCSEETLRTAAFEPGTRPSLQEALDRVHPEDRPRIRAMLEQAMKDNSLLDYENRLLLPDGSIKHVHVVARTLRDAANTVEFVGAVMDVTEQKKTEQALRAAKARFEGILAIAEDAIISVDSSQRIVLFNQGAEKVFGYDQAEVIGKPLDLLLPQRFAHAHRGHIDEFATSADVSRVMGQRREVFGRRKDGGEFPAEASISKLDLGGDLVFTVILRDVTERKQAAEMLHASEKFARGQAEALTQALDSVARESSPDRIVEHVLRTMTRQLDAHSSSVWLRDEASGLMGFEFALEDGQFKTKSDAAIAAITPSLPVDQIWPWPEVFRTGKPCVLEDIRNGPDFPWRAHVLAQGIVTILVVPMLVVGEVAGVIGIRFRQQRTFRTEETELARALANQAMLAMQLTRLSAQSRRSAVMAERNRMARDIHDTLAQGFTGVIVQLEAAEDAKSKGLAKEAEEHLGRLGDLARESLNEARRSVRALRPRALEEKNLREALEDLIRKMTAGTPVRAGFALQGQPRALATEWDENLLRIGQEVLTNTLRHAHATEFKAQLIFDTEAIRLELRDNGRGFDPGARHDGFGLVGMRERVQGMGGRLTIHSGIGEGTSIVIALPHTDRSIRSRMNTDANG